MSSAVRIADGAFDFSYGADSSRVTTVKSALTPEGLPRNALAWMDNCTARRGGLTQRYGWVKLLVMSQAQGIFQGEYLYQPQFANPYKIVSVGGSIYKVLVEAPFTVTNLSQQFNLFNPPTPTQVWMAQGEQFLVIQAGDIDQPNPTLPLFWDGTTLRRSVGLNVPGPVSGTYTLVPVAGWVVPPAGGSVTVTLSTSYPGRLGDQLQWPGIGTFTVSAISGNTVTLVTVQSTQTGLTVTPNSYVVGVTAGAAPATYTVTTTNIAAANTVGNTFVITLSAPYAGNVGDTVQWVGQGSFIVQGLTNASQTVAAQWTQIFALPAAAATYTWIATPPASPSGNVTTQVTTTNTPATPGGVGSTISVDLSAPYTGNVGDSLYWIGIGTFTILGFSNANQTLALSLVSIFHSPLTAGNYVWVEVESAATPAAGVTPELPAAGPMKYYQGRMWYANGNAFVAGDIVGGPSGTAAYAFTDAILKVTENPLAIGGDGFKVGANAGNITALEFNAQLDAALGQGILYIFTRKLVFSLQVPVTRNDWIGASGSNAPLVAVANIKYGSASDRCTVQVNGDIFYTTIQPSITSLFQSQRYFKQWGNVPISNNENRVLQFNDRSLMDTSTGIAFDNRLLMGILPMATSRGVAFQGLAPLDFDLISTLQEQRPPAWEGLLEGLSILQLTEGDFGGVERAFATVVDPTSGDLEVWELTNFAKNDSVAIGGNRVQWFFETPAWTWQKEFEMKKLDGLELWVDRVSGTVEFQFQYRPDADACWTDWANTKFCSAANSCEDANNPICYPIQEYCEGNKFPIVLPTPPVPTKCQPLNNRPANVGYQFQVRVNVKGFCRIRGIMVFAIPVERKPYEGLSC